MARQIEAAKKRGLRVKVYLATSWRNESAVLLMAKTFREQGIEVYCFAELGQGQHVFMWPDVVDPEVDDGITALANEHSVKAYDVDLKHLDWADAVVLINPCGRDAHLEAGYKKGQGGMLFVLGDWPKGEYSNMYRLVDALFRWEQIGELVDILKREVYRHE